MGDGDWTRLAGVEDQRFRLQRAALLAFVRASLPTRLSRRTLLLGLPTPGAMPAEVWQRGDEVALVWHVRHEHATEGNPAKRVVGFVRQVRGRSIELLDSPFNADLPEPLQDAENIRFSDSFWRSDRSPPSTEPPPESNIDPTEASQEITAAPHRAAPVPPSHDKGTQETERIQVALGLIDAALRENIAQDTPHALIELKLEPIETPDEATNWQLVGDMRERRRVAELLKKARVCNFQLEADTTHRMILLKRAVPFYKGCRLYRVIDMRGPRSRFASFVLHLESADLAALDIRSAPILAFNDRRIKQGELQLDSRNVAAYLRFYCEFVQGEAGAFPIIESPNEIRWLSHAENGANPPQATSGTHTTNATLKRVLSSALQPVHIYRLVFESDTPAPPTLEAPPEPALPDQPETQALMHCRVFVGYGRHLFAAGMSVKEDGGVTMFADEALHDNPLPIQPLSFSIESQFSLRTAADPAASPDRRT